MPKHVKATIRIEAFYVGVPDDMSTETIESVLRNSVQSAIVGELLQEDAISQVRTVAGETTCWFSHHYTVTEEPSCLDSEST